MIVLFTVLRFVGYALAFGLGYSEIPYYFIFAAAILVVTFKSLSDPIRFNILRDKLRKQEGFINALVVFAFADSFVCFILFGIGKGVSIVFS